MKKTRKSNFDLFSSYSYYTPGFGGIGAILLWFLAGMVMGSVVAGVFTLLMPGADNMQYAMLISYPLMFVPPMMYANLQSKRNAFFDTGYALSSDNYGRIGGFRMALLVMLATLAIAYVSDVCSEILPPAPEWFDQLMGTMVGGKFWVNFISVSIFAPLFEEWLCRGEVLRGLLNYRKKDGSRGIRPGWAIVLSALFFALIHGNPWQAVPAFLMGLLFGYVYYRTGSLKLTMLMHFTNNTFSLVMSRAFPGLENADHYSEILPAPQYWLIAGASVLLVLLCVKIFSTIELKDRQGNCDEVRAA